MKYVIYFCFILFLFGINVALAFVFNLRLLVPSLIFIAVINFAAARSSYDFFFVAMAAGLILDLYSRALPGSFTLAFLIVAYLLNIAAHWTAVLEVDWKFLLASVTLSLTAVYLLVWAYSAAAVSLHWTGASFSFRSRLSVFITELALDLLLVLPLYYLIERFKFRVEIMLNKHRVVR